MFLTFYVFCFTLFLRSVFLPRGGGFVQKKYFNLVLYQIPRAFRKHPLAKAGPCRDAEAEEKGGSYVFEAGRMRCFGSILTVTAPDLGWDNMLVKHVHQPLGRVGHPCVPPARKRCTTVFC